MYFGKWFLILFWISISIFHMFQYSVHFLNRVWLRQSNYHKSYYFFMLLEYWFSVSSSFKLFYKFQFLLVLFSSWSSFQVMMTEFILLLVCSGFCILAFRLLNVLLLWSLLFWRLIVKLRRQMSYHWCRLLQVMYVFSFNEVQFWLYYDLYMITL